MFKRIGLAVLAVALLAVPASAQFVPVLDNFSLTLGAGTSVPARAEAFTSGYSPAFYRVLLVEYKFNDWLRTFGKYDRAIFDSQSDGNGDQLDFTAWGLGIMLFAPVLPRWDIYGKVSAESTTLENAGMEWAPQTALGVNYKAGPNSDFRAELGFKTFSETDVLESFTIHGAVNFHKATP